MGMKIALAALAVVFLITSYSEAQLFRRFRGPVNTPQTCNQYNRTPNFQYPRTTPAQAWQGNNQLGYYYAVSNAQAPGFVQFVPSDQYRALVEQQRRIEWQRQLANRPLIERPQYNTVGQLPLAVRPGPTSATSPLVTAPTFAAPIRTQDAEPVSRTIVQPNDEQTGPIIAPDDSAVMPASASIPFDDGSATNSVPVIEAEGPAILPEDAPAPERNPFQPTDGEPQSILEGTTGGN